MHGSFFDPIPVTLSSPTPVVASFTALELTRHVASIKETGINFGQGFAKACSTIAEKHHGRITIESIVGDRPTFIVQLPVHRSDLAEENVAV